MKNDECKLLAYRRKDRERKAKQAKEKASLSEKEKALLKLKKTASQWRWRAKRRRHCTGTDSKGPKDSRRATGATSVFKGPQSFGKAAVKKSLPQSRSKIPHVIAKVVQDMSPDKRRAVLEVCNNPVKRSTLEGAERRKRSDARLGDEIK